MAHNRISFHNKSGSLICDSVYYEDDNARIERIRAFVKHHYVNTGHCGFSDDFDRYFDPFSVYFYVYDVDENIHAVQRIIHKTPNNMLPMEMASIYGSAPNEKYKVDAENVVELTSFVFSGAEAIEMLVACMAYYGKVNNVKKAYALLDKEERKMKKLYKIIGWKESARYNCPVFFGDYGKESAGKFRPIICRESHII